MAQSDHIIEIIIQTNDQTGGALGKMQNSLLALDRAVQKTHDRMKRTFSDAYSASIRLIDNVTPAGSKINDLLKRLTGKTYQLALRLNDGATNSIRNLETKLMKLTGKAYTIAVDAKKILKGNLNLISVEKISAAAKIILNELKNAEEKISKLEKISTNLENLPGEIWRDIDGYDGKYQVSNFGRVKTFQRNITKIMIPQKHDQYLAVGLSKFSQQKKVCIHVLVAKAFIPNQENKPQVNHIDGDKRNNCVENLEWATSSENTQHAFDTGLAKALRGTQNATAKFTKEQVKEIRKIYVKGDKNFGIKALSKKFSVGTGTITRIINRETYKDVE